MLGNVEHLAEHCFNYSVGRIYALYLQSCMADYVLYDQNAGHHSGIYEII
jgi:hypothetical protein